MNAMLRRSLAWGGWLALALLIVGGGIGWLVGGPSGLASAAVGTALAVVYMGLTAGSMLIADVATKGRPSIVVFFGTLLGVFAIKVVLFVIVALWLRTQDWLSPGVFGVTAVVAVVGTLGIDVLAMRTSRVPYVEVELPTVPEEPSDPSSGAPKP